MYMCISENAVEYEETHLFAIDLDRVFFIPQCRIINIIFAFGNLETIFWIPLKK